MRESKFHLSVMQWLAARNYKYWWEQTLIGTMMRPDFLAVSPEGEKSVIECKAKSVIPFNRIETIHQYVSLLNEKHIHAYLAIPDDLILSGKFIRRVEATGIQLLRIPVTTINFESLQLSTRNNVIGDYFDLFATTPIVGPQNFNTSKNQWGRLILE